MPISTAKKKTTRKRNLSEESLCRILFIARLINLVSPSPHRSYELRLCGVILKLAAQIKNVHGYGIVRGRQGHLAPHLLVDLFGADDAAAVSYQAKEHHYYQVEQEQIFDILLHYPHIPF